MSEVLFLFKSICNIEQQVNMVVHNNVLLNHSNIIVGDSCLTYSPSFPVTACFKVPTITTWVWFKSKVSFHSVRIYNHKGSPLWLLCAQYIY